MIYTKHSNRQNDKKLSNFNDKQSQNYMKMQILRPVKRYDIKQ